MKNNKHWRYMLANRKPTIQETKLIELLIAKASLDIPAGWKDDLLVRPMNDSGIGSIYLYPNGEVNKQKEFGKEASDLQFKDKDGIDVIVTLNLDENGKLFELDIWKTNFSDIIKLPDL